MVVFINFFDPSFLELAKEASRLGAEGELAGHDRQRDARSGLSEWLRVCEVEVDPETGLVEIARYSVVDDVGRCINPSLAVALPLATPGLDDGQGYSLSMIPALSTTWPAAKAPAASPSLRPSAP
jgi:hypothetical protein